jgi:membrane-associated protease RseP (regulator of RpoE activity)
LFLATCLTTLISGSWFWAGNLDLVAAGRFGTAHLFSPAVLAEGLSYAVPLMLILTAHEFGHYFACRYYGIPVTLPMFIPSIPPIGTFGAVIRIRGVIPNRRALLDVAAAGPIAGFLVALPTVFFGIRQARPVESIQGGGLFFGDPWLSTGLALPIHGDADLLVGPVYMAGWVGMLVTSMNLFPVGQLDAGHAVYAVSRRAHRVLSWATLAVLAGLVAWQAWSTRSFPSYAIWLAILLFLRDRHPRLLDEHERLGPGRLAIVGVLALIFALTFMPVPIRFVE